MRFRFQQNFSRRGKIQRLRCFSFFILWAVFSSFPAYADTSVPIEYQVKAVYIHKFLNYIEWPPSEAPANPDKIVIGVLGESPLFGALELFRAKDPDNKTKVIRLESLQDIETLHILFISPSKREGWDKILSALKGKNMLTISEEKDFCKMGGMIQFILLGGKVKFEVNLRAVRGANIKISARMLRAAIKVWHKD